MTKIGNHLRECDRKLLVNILECFWQHHITFSAASGAFMLCFMYPKPRKRLGLIKLPLHTVQKYSSWMSAGLKQYRGTVRLGKAKFITWRIWKKSRIKLCGHFYWKARKQGKMYLQEHWIYWDRLNVQENIIPRWQGMGISLWMAWLFSGAGLCAESQWYSVLATCDRSYPTSNGLLHGTTSKKNSGKTLFSPPPVGSIGMLLLTLI